MKLNLKSLALCAAMLSFGFAKNTDHIYANHTQICNAIDNKQIDNIYTVFTGVTNNPSKSLMTGQNNILYFDVTKERIPFPLDFFPIGVGKNLNNNDYFYSFQYNSGRLLFSCQYTYNIDDHYPCILCSVATTDKFDNSWESMEPIFNVRDPNGNETKTICQQLVSFRYTPYGENSADIQLRTLSKDDMNLDDYQRKLGIHGLSIETLAAIGKFLMERAPKLFDNLQKKEFTKDDKDHFINVIKKYRDNINSRRF